MEQTSVKAAWGRGEGRRRGGEGGEGVGRRGEEEKGEKGEGEKGRREGALPYTDTCHMPVK